MAQGWEQYDNVTLFHGAGTRFSFGAIIGDNWYLPPAASGLSPTHIYNIPNKSVIHASVIPLPFDTSSWTTQGCIASDDNTLILIGYIVDTTGLFYANAIYKYIIDSDLYIYMGHDALLDVADFIRKELWGIVGEIAIVHFFTKFAGDAGIYTNLLALLNYNENVGWNPVITLPYYINDCINIQQGSWIWLLGGNAYTNVPPNPPVYRNRFLRYIYPYTVEDLSPIGPDVAETILKGCGGILYDHNIYFVSDNAANLVTHRYDIGLNSWQHDTWSIAPNYPNPRKPNGTYGIHVPTNGSGKVLYAIGGDDANWFTVDRYLLDPVKNYDDNLPRLKVT